MRNRDPHRENAENILSICLPIMTIQHIRESPSTILAMRKSAWNVVLRPWSVDSLDGGFFTSPFHTVNRSKIKIEITFLK